MAAHYEKVCGNLKRSEIIKELELLSGKTQNESGGHNGHQVKSRDIVASEYGFSSRNAARYLRLNYLIQPFKDRIDENKLGLVAAVDLSYLEEQQMVWGMMERQELKMKPRMAAELRKSTGKLTEQVVVEIMEGLAVKKRSGNSGVSLLLPKTICRKYFDGLDPEQMMSVVELALEASFKAEGVEKHV
ncbi:hypothetical protein [Robinsoniella peoriensis]|uniref:hypothetical protein n=1 Tax=Robinsoniella peoriensis TaxID=180332 RepID=UPI003753D77F